MVKLQNILFLSVIALCVMSTQCDEDEVLIDYDNICDQTVVVDETSYNMVDTDNYQFSNVEIEGDCTTITFGASGCDGSTWAFTLIDSGTVAESLPEQRYLKFELKNSELCDAFFQRTVSFNLKPLQIENGVNKVVLHLEGWDTAITYNF